MFLDNGRFVIFFGDKNSCNIEYKSHKFNNFCVEFESKYHLEKILFNKQVHGCNGFLIDSKISIQNFKNIENEGDFLITNQNNIGIGVLTADCLPILFYDTINHVAASIHAGWRSSVLGICKATFEILNKKYGTNPQNLEVYFGPCAKVCCYRVQQDFLLNLEHFPFRDNVIQFRGKDLFFDNVLLNKFLIQEFGVNPKKINRTYNFCTICNHDFYSYRREAQTGFRQISFIALK